MKIAKTILLVFLIIQIIPILSIVFLSFQNHNENPFKWYVEIIENESFRSALGLSSVISIIVALSVIVLCFIVSLSWFDSKQRFVVIVLILITGLLPPDIMALSISRISQLLGINSSNIFFLIIAQTLYCFPLGVLIFWSRYYFIKDSLLIAANDLGMKKSLIILKIILPLSNATIISVFILSFLLVFNEYPRTYYLSGSFMFISEFLNGKLSSGTDSSIYAGGSITIFITVFFILIFSVFMSVFNKKTA
jgi:spermidine/putrescine transport system permease protein